MRMNTLRLMPLALALMLLTGCAPAASNTVALCPYPAHYSESFRQEAANELRSLPPAPHVDQLLQDYILLRDKLRGAAKASAGK